MAVIVTRIPLEHIDPVVRSYTEILLRLHRVSTHIDFAFKIEGTEEQAGEPLIVLHYKLPDKCGVIAFIQRGDTFWTHVPDTARHRLDTEGSLEGSLSVVCHDMMEQGLETHTLITGTFGIDYTL